MKKELEDKLFKKYPTLFPNGRNVDKMESLMVFGFECDDGWFKLIDNLCKDILKYKEGNKVIVVQVKEKFGGLRFYTEGTSDEIYELIRKAEEDSYNICEICGEPGKNREVKMWYKTVCDKHFKQLKGGKKK